MPRTIRIQFHEHEPFELTVADTATTAEVSLLLETLSGSPRVHSVGFVQDHHDYLEGDQVRQVECARCGKMVDEDETMEVTQPYGDQKTLTVCLEPFGGSCVDSRSYPTGGPS